MGTLRSILLLDDSQDYLELVSCVVERLCGCKPVAMTKLSEIQAQSSVALDCAMAFLDINLGPSEPNGVDVYQWLRASGFAGPIFFLTGHARSHPLVAAAVRLGDAQVLSKPIATVDLIRLVKGDHGAF